MDKNKESAYREWVIGQLKAEGVPENEWEKVDELERKLLRMPKSQIRIIGTSDLNQIAAHLYCVEDEHGEYWACWQYFSLSDLPNNLISLDDLKRFGIEPVNRETVGGDQ